MSHEGPTVDGVADRLRARGERMTRPRRAVLTVMAAHGGHLTVEQIGEAVTAVEPGVHLASVYRTLGALAELGVVQHVHVGHGATTYHLVDAGGPHPHAQCSTCGDVHDLPADLLEDVARRLATDIGFTLDDEHVALSGTCRRCRTGGALPHAAHV